MYCSDDSIKELLKYQRKYGQRRSEPRSFWILKKRTINLAFVVISSVKGQDFAELEEKIYFPCKVTALERFQRLFEGQLEDALLRPEEFVQNLDSFFMKTCLMIEQEHLYREFYDFCAVLEQRRAKKLVVKMYLTPISAWSCSRPPIFAGIIWNSMSLAYHGPENCFSRKTHIHTVIWGTMNWKNIFLIS